MEDKGALNIPARSFSSDQQHSQIYSTLFDPLDLAIKIKIKLCRGYKVSLLTEVDSQSLRGLRGYHPLSCLKLLAWQLG